MVAPTRGIRWREWREWVQKKLAIVPALLKNQIGMLLENATQQGDPGHCSSLAFQRLRGPH